MQSAIAIITALIVYITSLFTAIPAFVADIENDPLGDLTMIVSEAEIREVGYDELYEYHQNYYVPLQNFGDPALFPDLTEDYQALLDENLKIAMEWKKSPGQGQMNFYNSVKNFGCWDYKRPAAHPDWHSKTKNGKFTAYGVVMNWEVIGNINFGFTGAAVGFTPAVILTGGGLVNVLGGNGRWDEIKYYYDDKEDNDWITFGIGLYALADTEYLEQSSLIDNFLTIVDPKIIGAAKMIYDDVDAFLLIWEEFFAAVEEDPSIMKDILADCGVSIG